MLFFWCKKGKKGESDAPVERRTPAPIPPPSDNPYLNPASESEYTATLSNEEADEDEGGDASGESSGGSGGGPRARRNDEEKTARGTASQGNRSIGGATSKSDSDAKMTDKQRNAIIRNASVQVRAMSDAGDAMDKASSGQFNTLDSEVKAMSGQDLYTYMSSNPAQMGKTGDMHVQQKMIQDGYGKQLDVLTQGTYEAEQKTGRKEVMAALMAKPLTEMDPSQLAYVWDKLGELGEVSGPYDGNIAKLEAAVGGFVMSSAAGEQLVKDGRVSLSSGNTIKGPDPSLKIAFTMAVQNITSKVTTAYHQVLNRTMRPGKGM